MQQQPTFNFGLIKNFLFIYRTLSMRKKPETIEIRGQMQKKNVCLVPKSPTQMGSLSAKNASKKFSSLGTFNIATFPTNPSFL